MPRSAVRPTGPSAARSSGFPSPLVPSSPHASLTRSAARSAARATVSLAALALLAPSALGAQSLIVGIPNAEATPHGAWFFTHESQVVPTAPRSWNTFQFLTYGIGHVGRRLAPGGLETELALSFVNFGRPATGNRTIAGGLKSVFAFPTGALHRWEARLTGGAMLPVSLDGLGVGSWLYTSASVRLPRLATRLTVGPTYGTPQLFGVEKLGAMAGVEQPLGGPFRRKVSLIADWYSGRHDLAATIPALQLNLPRDFILIGGYKLPNRGAPGGRALVVEVAGILARTLHAPGH